MASRIAYTSAGWFWARVPRQHRRNWRIFHEGLQDEAERVGRNCSNKLGGLQEYTLDPEAMHGPKNNDRNRHEDEPQQ